MDAQALKQEAFDILLRAQMRGSLDDPEFSDFDVHGLAEISAELRANRLVPLSWPKFSWLEYTPTA